MKKAVIFLLTVILFAGSILPAYAFDEVVMDFSNGQLNGLSEDPKWSFVAEDGVQTLTCTDITAWLANMVYEAETPDVGIEVKFMVKNYNKKTESDWWHGFQVVIRNDNKGLEGYRVNFMADSADLRTVGDSKTLGQPFAAVPVNKWTTLKFIAKGNMLEVYVDNSKKVTLSDTTTPGAGKIQIISGAADIRVANIKVFDPHNVTVTEPPASSAPVTSTATSAEPSSSEESSEISSEEESSSEISSAASVVSKPSSTDSGKEGGSFTWIIVALIVVVVAGAGAAAFFILKKPKNTETGTTEEKRDE